MKRCMVSDGGACVYSIDGVCDRTMKVARLIGALFFSLALSASAVAQTADTPLKVGVIPITDVAPLYVGIAKGFFKEEHLAIESVPAQGGAAIVPAVISGDDQIGFSNMVSLILAAEHGLPVQAVAYGAGINDGKPAAAVMVGGASPIKSYKDLAGKTIAVNSVNNIGDVTISDVLARHGVNPATVKYVEMGFPEMPAALKQNRVDAIWANEPFLSAAKADGARIIFANYEEYDAKLTVAAYFTTHQYATEHADIVARFARAMAKSNTYAQAHPAEARAALSSYTKLDAAAVANIAIAGWYPAINVASTEKLVKSMVTYGLLKSPVDVKALLGNAGGR